MITTLRDRSRQINFVTWLVAVAVLALAFYLGRRASPTWLGLIAVGIGGALLLARPLFGLPALVLAAVVIPIEFSVGNYIKLNLASAMTPALLVLWLLDMIRRKRLCLTASATNRPLAFFLAAGLLSLLIGRATWDMAVPVPDNFLIVQLAQWAIFAFSAGAFWLAANLTRGERSLRRLTALFLIVGGGLAIVRALPGIGGAADALTTGAFIRAPFWVLLAALAAGQLLFNRPLSLSWRIFLILVLGVSLVYAFVQQQEAASNWVGLMTALGVLLWLRFPRLSWPLAVLVAALVITGVLIPSLYDFAGGDAEWATSGGSRLVLIERVVEVSMRNPITGLGPAAYRPYANMKPLPYQGAYWVAPQINSHNNYVDLFAHVGIVGLALFFWFAVEIARLGKRLRSRYTQGFAAGYVNSVLAAGVAALVIMAFADWILPFVYNIGFHGFQASVLVWLFLGGLVALENMAGPGSEDRLQSG